MFCVGLTEEQPTPNPNNTLNANTPRGLLLLTFKPMSGMQFTRTTKNVLIANSTNFHRKPLCLKIHTLVCNIRPNITLSLLNPHFIRTQRDTKQSINFLAF